MREPHLVCIPRGSFHMGENAEDKFANDTERPAHEVTFVEPFLLGVFPVTGAEWAEYCGKSGPTGEEELPVVKVSWEDATAFCTELRRHTGRKYRLPSEAEWEYAARAGSAEAFAFGHQLSVEQANFLYDEQGQRVGRGSRTPAGTYRANALGVLDMHGNVSEWVQDAWHPTYQGAPVDGTAWEEPGATRRIIRGGAWDYLPRLLRSSWRDALPATVRRDNVGFRVACDL